MTNKRYFDRDNVSQHETNCLVDQTDNCIKRVWKKGFGQKTLGKIEKTKHNTLRISFPATENSL